MRMAPLGCGLVCWLFGGRETGGEPWEADGGEDGGEGEDAEGDGFGDHD